MEDPPEGDGETSYHAPPYSQRELNSLLLCLMKAPTDADKKHIVDEAGMTFEEAKEHFSSYGFGIVDFTGD
ncbi:hypothetical protein [Streptomyces sp. NBC_00986]|uniref:hypothetical protein n=1 Tax=Streptomyces sp. NBC_00986 TaxID=2903702 RepID=UPI00386FF2CE|nr:hypothetical protein OG504_32810 [Streptomyces sp. NBC_00986]